MTTKVGGRGTKTEEGMREQSVNMPTQTKFMKGSLEAAKAKYSLLRAAGFYD